MLFFCIFMPNFNTNNKFYVCNTAFLNVFFLIFTFHNHHIPMTNVPNLISLGHPYFLFFISPLVLRNLAGHPT